MKKPLSIFTLVCTLCSSLLFCDPLDDNELMQPETVSKALGHTFAKNLMETPGFSFDIPSVVEGMQDALEGRPSPLSDAEYERAFDVIQQKYLDELSTANLTQADVFLNNNIKENNVEELVPGKLQVSVIKEGEGEATINNSNNPVVVYTGKYLDETQIESADNEPVTIQMQQAIPGLQKGLVGAKKGEQRRLYIHPELCHSPTDQAPISDPLMILDVTVLETDSQITDE
ncbi:MAG: hypothetical protein S4CHLAM6_06490 [Chlamydiae bacterium]|nr:hypothetical protein [Chlamydiota bacterium]